MAKVANWNDKEFEEVREGVWRKAFMSDNATVCIHRLYPGHEPRPHSHPNEQIAYIVSGTVDFHVGGKVYSLGPEDIIAIPGGVEHYAVVTGDEVCVHVDVFTPARPEYGG